MPHPAIALPSTHPVLAKILQPLGLYQTNHSYTRELDDRLACLRHRFFDIRNGGDGVARILAAFERRDSEQGVREALVLFRDYREGELAALAAKLEEGACLATQLRQLGEATCINLHGQIEDCCNRELFNRRASLDELLKDLALLVYQCIDKAEAIPEQASRWRWPERFGTVDAVSDCLAAARELAHRAEYLEVEFNDLKPARAFH